MRRFPFNNPFKVHFKLDTDRDGVWDWKDCRPFDYTRQHTGPSELKGDVDVVHEKVMLNAIKRYPSSRQMALMINNAVKKFFLHPREEFLVNTFDNLVTKRIPMKPTGMKVQWYDTKKYLLDVFDPMFDVHHYVYMAGKKTVARPGTPVPLVSITSLDRERMGEREFDKMINWARDMIRKKIKRGY